MAKHQRSDPLAPFLKRVTVVPERLGEAKGFPLGLPFVGGLDLDLGRKVTFFVGENGSGKSTLLEAIADLAGFHATGGGRTDAADSGRVQHEKGSTLAAALRLAFTQKPKDGFFLRAETLVNFASLLDQRASDPAFGGNPYVRYGGRSLHARSHGEAFLDVLEYRTGPGLFLFDEPEAALSPQRQLSLLHVMWRLVEDGLTQFIVATHSPILMTFPDAGIVSFDDPSLPLVPLEDTSHFGITRDFLASPARFWKHLAKDPGDDA